MTHILPGERAPLCVTKEAKQRIYAGLSWPPRQLGLLDKMQEFAGLTAPQHNLDLSCYLFSQAGQVLEIIDQREAFAQSQDGHGHGDREQISAELKNLPNAIHSFVFVARIETADNFKVPGPVQIKLADGYTDREFLSLDISLNSTANNNTYVFCRILRSDGSWVLENIDRYLHTDSYDDIEDALTPLLLSIQA